LLSSANSFFFTNLRVFPAGRCNLGLTSVTRIFELILSSQDLLSGVVIIDFFLFM
jgi:hypothetical protein